MKNLLPLLQISLVLSLATPFITNARDLTWTGAASGNWNDSANFSPMFVPTAIDTVTIDAGTNHPQLTADVTLYRLVLLDDTFDLKGYQLNITNEALFSGGWLVDGQLECKGTLASFAGTVIETTVKIDCTTLELNGSVFNLSCYFKAETGDSQGDNTFMAPVSLVHVGTSGSISLAMDQGDTFHDTLYVTNTSDGNIHLTQADTSHFKNCVRISSTGTGSIHFGREGGISILEINGHLVVENGEFTAGQLFIKNIEQQNATGHRMVLTGTGSSDEHSLLAVDNCHFTGEVDFSAPNLLLSINRFDGEAMFTKTGGYDNVSTGDNLFNADASFTNNSTTGHLLLTGSREDRFLGTAQFTSGSMRVISGYGATTIFEGDVVVNSGSVGFYRLKFTGEAEQTLSGTTGHLYGETELDKASGSVTATIPIAIDRRLTFTKGYLVTDSVNLITFLAGATASGATDSSFVAGPVKKVGNTAFEFPVGKDGHFRPVGISAPDSVTDAFVGEYFAQGQEFGSTIDTSLNTISSCEFWTLKRTSGNSEIEISLYWGSTSCSITYPENMRVACWNDTLWQNIGNENYSGSLLNGTVRSNISAVYYDAFTLANVPIVYSGPPNLGEANSFALLSGKHIISDSSTIANGKAGAVHDVINVLSNDSILTNNSGSVPGALASLEQAIMYVNGLSSTLINDSIDGKSYNEGIYSFIGNAIINDSIILNGDSSSVFIFNISGSLSVDSGTVVYLNGVHSYNVFWNVNDDYIGDVFINFPGIVISRGIITAYRFHNPMQTLMSLDSIILFAHEFDLMNNMFNSLLYQHYYYNLVMVGCNFSYDYCNEIRNSHFEHWTPPLSGIFHNILEACPWDAATTLFAISTDYYNSFTTSPWVGLPNNMMGCENDHSSPGNFLPEEDAYAGIYAFNSAFPQYNQYREYLQQQLNSPLSSGLYYGEFFVSLADRSSLNVNSLGMHFSTGSIIQPFQSPIIVNAQVQSNYSNQLTLTNGWERVSDCFQAAGGESHVIIGNFNDNSGTLTAINQFYNNCPNGNLTFPSCAYYYIDDPVVVPFSVDAGSDITLSCGTSAQLLGLPTCINSLNTGQFIYSWNQISGPTGIVSLSNPSIFDPVVSLISIPSSQVIIVLEITVTTATGCNTSDQVTITVSPNTSLNVGLTISSACDGSLGSITTVINGGTAPFLYSWNTGSSAANLISLQNGTYTVTVTDANGCSGTQSATINNQNMSFTLTGDFQNCQYSDDLCFAISNYDNTQWGNYQWSVIVNSGPPLTLLVNTVTGTACVDFPPNVTGSVSVTYSAPGCTLLSSLPIVLCCELTGAGDEIRDHILSSELLIGSSQSVSNINGVIHINAGSNQFLIQKTITLDGDLIIENSPNIIFGPGGGIIVPNGFILSVLYSTLQGCDYMWRGIRIQNGGTLTTYDPTFMDAQYAVNAENGGNYIIRNGTFTNNYMGIRATGSNFAVRLTASALFEGPGPLLPDFPGQSPSTCGRGYAGVQAVDVASVLNIGVDPLTDDIEFRDLVYGIYSESSNINVVGCTFENIETTPVFNSCFGNTQNANGSGIFSLNRRRGPRTLYQRGFGMTGTVSFQNSRFGIFTRRTISDVQLNNMTDNLFGIRTFANYSGGISEFNHNRINSFIRGIEVIDAQVMSNTNIFYNEISLDAGINPNRIKIGISMTNQFGGLGVTEVIENEITIESIHHRAISSSSTLLRNGILQNDVYFNGTGSLNRGIWAENSPDVEIKCNTIAGNSTAQGVGINVISSANARVECNSTTNTRHGIRFDGNNATVDFRTNTINNHGIGFVLSNGGIIDHQYNKGNIWTSTAYSPFGAWSTANSDANLSRFFVENSTSGQYQTTRSNDPLFTVYFLPGCTNNCWPVCSTSVDCSIRPLAEETYYLSRVDSLTAQDSLEFVQFHDYTVWSLKRNLYRKLLRDPDLMVENELFEDFFENASGTSFAIAAQIMEGLSSLPEEGGDEIGLMEINLLTSDSLKLLVLVNDSIIMNPPSAQDSLDVIDENITLRATIDSLTLVSDTLNMVIDDRVRSAVLELVSLNASMPVSNQFEEILRTMNAISFRILLDDPTDRDLSSAEQEWVLSVAPLCPFDFGEAVFVARNIAGIQLGDTIYYEDDSLCVMPEARFGNTETSSPASYVVPTNPHIKVYPNPFSSNLIVECSGCENDLLKYEIYSTMGILTHQGSVVEKRINADRLSPGLYFIKVFNNKQSLYSGKIVKQ